MAIKHRILNKYTRTKYLTSQFRINLPYHLKFLKAFLRNGFRAKKILFYPEIPDTPYIIFKICHYLGVKMTNDPNSQFDLAIRWEDATFKKDDPLFDLLTKKTEVINVNCTDISKSKVDKIFEDVFGYSTKIDPLIFQGKMVEKSEINALHNGQIIDGPIKEKKRDYIYQKVINNQVDENCFLDLRASIFKDKVLYVIVKLRQSDTRFTDHYPMGFYARSEDIFSPEELGKIIQFCQKMGLDFGDLDILRDSDDGKIYIVDVNNTVHGPPKGLLQTEYEKVLKIAAQAFQKQFLS